MTDHTTNGNAALAVVRERAPHYDARTPAPMPGGLLAGYRDPALDAILAQLATPFATSDLRWRVQSSGLKHGKPWARLLAYVSRDAIAERLDAVVGVGNWAPEYRALPTNAEGLLCGLSLWIPRAGVEHGGSWVTKWDGAGPTQVEAVKGMVTAAFKRAAAQWGIGRYLARVGEQWATFGEHGPFSLKIKDGTGDRWFKWHAPSLPAEFQPHREALPVIGSEPPTARPHAEPTAPTSAIGEAELIPLPRLAGFAQYGGKALGALSVPTIEAILREHETAKPNLAAKLRVVLERKRRVQSDASVPF